MTWTSAVTDGSCHGEVVSDCVSDSCVCSVELV